MRLDTERDQFALHQTVARIRPALLLLDPLVRLHSLDENSASDISSLLGFLRALNRRHQLALILVHHMAKRSRRNLGQSLRGSSDLHAWTDSACYLLRRPDDRLLLTVEHRAAPAPEPLLLRLSGGADQPLALIVDSAAAPPPPLAEAVRAALRSAGSRSPGLSCANACASTTPVSVSPSNLSNSAASPSAAPPAGACQPDPPSTLDSLSAGHCSTVPAFRSSTHSERNDHRPHSAPSTVQLPRLGRATQHLGVGEKVGHRNNTMLHLAERRALGDDQETIAAGAPILVDGVRQWVSYREPDIDEDDFDEAGAAFERQDATTRTGAVGQARATLLQVRPLVDFAVHWFKRHRNAAD